MNISKLLQEHGDLTFDQLYFYTNESVDKNTFWRVLDKLMEKGEIEWYHNEKGEKTYYLDV